MKALKVPAKPVKQNNIQHKAKRFAIVSVKNVCKLVVLLLAAYGLRHLYIALPDQLRDVLTGLTILLLGFIIYLVDTPD